MVEHRGQADSRNGTSTAKSVSHRQKTYTNGGLRAPKNERLKQLILELSKQDLSLFKAIASPQGRLTLEELERSVGRRGPPEQNYRPLLREMVLLRKAQPNLSVPSIARRVIKALAAPKHVGPGQIEVSFDGHQQTAEALSKTLTRQYRKYEQELTHGLSEEERGAALANEVLSARSSGYGSGADPGSVAGAAPGFSWNLSQESGRPACGVTELKVAGFLRALNSRGVKSNKRRPEVPVVTNEATVSSPALTSAFEKVSNKSALTSKCVVRAHAGYIAGGSKFVSTLKKAITLARQATRA